MNSPRHKLEKFSWIAGIAGTLLAFYLAFKPSVEAQPQALVSPISPSFDCPKASNKVERLICSAPEIAVLDLSMANAYRDLLAEIITKNSKNEMKDLQNLWLNSVRDKCVDTACLKNVYENRIKQLRDARR